MKFKIGDKVRILPSAVDIGVYLGEIGRVGVIKSIDIKWNEIMVLMDKPSTIANRTSRRTWYTKPPHIEPLIIVGQQLLFEFMQQS